MKRVVVLILLLIGCVDLFSSLDNALSAQVQSLNSKDGQSISNEICTSKASTNSDSKANDHHEPSDCHDCVHQCHLGHCVYIFSELDKKIDIFAKVNNQKIISSEKFLKSRLVSVETPPPNRS